MAAAVVGRGAHAEHMPTEHVLACSQAPLQADFKLRAQTDVYRRLQKPVDAVPAAQICLDHRNV